MFTGKGVIMGFNRGTKLGAENLKKFAKLHFKTAAEAIAEANNKK